MAPPFSSPSRLEFFSDGVAGTWTQAEVEAFEEAVAPFGEVDEALWRAENPA